MLGWKLSSICHQEKRASHDAAWPGESVTLFISSHYSQDHWQRNCATSTRWFRLLSGSWKGMRKVIKTTGFKLTSLGFWTIQILWSCSSSSKPQNVSVWCWNVLLREIWWATSKKSAVHRRNRLSTSSHRWYVQFTKPWELHCTLGHQTVWPAHQSFFWAEVQEWRWYSLWCGEAVFSTHYVW